MAQRDVKEGAEVSGPGLGRQLSAGEQWERYGRYPYLLAKLIFMAILVAAGLWVMRLLSPVLWPIFISFLIAYFLSPSVGWLESKGVPRWAGIIVLLTGGLAFLTVFAIFLYPTIATQISRIFEQLPKAIELIETRTIPWLSETFNLQVPQTAAEAMEAYGEQIQNASMVIVEGAAAWLQGTMTKAGAIVVSILNIVLIPIFTFYFLRDFNAGKASLARFIPPWRKEVTLDRLERMDRAVAEWFRGQLQVASILAVLYAIGLGISYGVTGHDVQSGIVIGLLTGFTNIIPYVGFAVGSVLAFMVVLIDWTGWGAVIGVVIAFSIIQTFESYYLTPRIVGDKVGLNPVTVIILLLIGGQVGGLLGILLVIPIAGAVKVLIPDIIAWYHESSIYTGRYSRPYVAVTGSGMPGIVQIDGAAVVDEAKPAAVAEAAAESEIAEEPAAEDVRETVEETPEEIEEAPGGSVETDDGVEEAEEAPKGEAKEVPGARTDESALVEDKKR